MENKKNTKQDSEERLNFLLEVLLVTSKSNADPRAVYPLLQANLDKLDDNFAPMLRNWATALLPKVEPELAKSIAAAIGNFSSLIGQFSLGTQASNLDIAIACCEVIPTVFTHEAFPKDWAKTQINLGNAYSNRIQGDRSENIERAITAYKAALQIFTRKAFPQDWATIQQSLGSAYSLRICGEQTQNLEEAISFYEAALQVFTQEMFPNNWAITQSNLGTAYCQWRGADWEENLERAIVAYKAALQVFTQEAFPQKWAMIQNNLGTAYNERISGERTQNLNLAIAAYEAALQVHTREAFPHQWATTQNNLGNAYREQRQIDSAIACYRLALKMHTPAFSPFECYRTGRNLGKVAFSAGRWKEAIEGYGVAIEAVETSRSWATSESRRQEIVAEALDVYENMVQACINAGKLEKAIEYVERSRSKRLVDLMVSNGLYQGGEIFPKVKQLLQQYDDLQERIDRERSSYDADNNRGLMGAGSSTSVSEAAPKELRAAFQAYNEAIATLEAQKQQIWNQIRSEDSVLAGEIQVSAPDFSAMQKLIDQPTTAILSFYTTNNDTHIFVLRQNQIALHTCTGQGLEKLQSWIFQNWLKSYVEDGNNWKSQIGKFLLELAQRLQISELISQHLEGITELILVPHLFLHQIPLAALPVGEGQYLGDKFLIRYTPSCQVLEFCQNRPHLGDSLTYGTVEDATEDLPCASFEGEQIARLHNIPEHQRLKGKSQAIVENYRKLAKKVQVLHSSHHAESRLDNPLESVLKLADGNITLGQLMTPGWRLPHLSDVFLSCCETGLGVTEITDDILTLSTGFLCAGARSVVSTLWSVDDLATALFSLFYYQHRQQGKSRPEALQHAQIKLRQFKQDDLAELAKQAEARQKQAIRERKQYQQGSAERLKWENEYRMYAGVTRQINRFKNSQDEFPFSHPRFWAAFTCQGLR